jgi:hypothetical protein
MRLQQTSHEMISKSLRIEDGLLDADENAEAKIQISEELCILKSENALLSLVDFVYPNIVQKELNANFFEDRANLCPTFRLIILYFL